MIFLFSKVPKTNANKQTRNKGKMQSDNEAPGQKDDKGEYANAFARMEKEGYFRGDDGAKRKELVEKFIDEQNLEKKSEPTYAKVKKMSDELENSWWSQKPYMSHCGNCMKYAMLRPQDAGMFCYDC